MRNPYMLDFPVNEYETRKKKLIQGLEKHGLDGAIFTSKENTRYFTGFQSIVWDSKVSTPAFLVVNKNGDYLMVGSHSSIGTMTVTSCLSDSELFYYNRASREPSVPRTYDEAIQTAVAKILPPGAKVGMETGAGFRVHMNYPSFKSLLEFMENKTMEPRDAARMIWEIRSIKSPREIEIMRKVCSINCALFEKAFNSVVPHVTSERDVYNVMGAEAFRLGCDTILDMGIRAGLDRDPHTNCPSSSRVIGSGHAREVLMIDGGPVYKGYYSDIIRTAVVGKPSRIQQSRHETAVEACYAALGMVRPGARMSEITKAVDDFIDEKGFGDCNKTRNWIGHGIGLDVHEYPCFEIGSDWELQPGMCFAVEPCICDRYGMFGIEQNILVLEDGYELLTPLRHDLFSIGW